MTVTLITGLSRPAKKNSARLFIAGGAKITRGRGCCTAGGGGGGGGGGSGGPDTVYRSQRWRLIPMSLFTAQFTKKEEQKKPQQACVDQQLSWRALLYKAPRSGGAFNTSADTDEVWQLPLKRSFL